MSADLNAGRSTASEGATPGFPVWRLSRKRRVAVERAVGPPGPTHPRYSSAAPLHGTHRSGPRPGRRQPGRPHRSEITARGYARIPEAGLAVTGRAPTTATERADAEWAALSGDPPGAHPRTPHLARRTSHRWWNIQPPGSVAGHEGGHA